MIAMIMIIKKKLVVKITDGQSLVKLARNKQGKDCGGEWQCRQL